jgi:hypothetical protein
MSAGYNIKREDRIAFRANEPATKAAIIHLAHERLGLSQPERPTGIYKYQGGIEIRSNDNRIEVAIYTSSVAEDWRRDGTYSKEEDAVAWSIVELARIVRENPNYLNEIEGVTIGDPLRNLCGL